MRYFLLIVFSFLVLMQSCSDDPNKKLAAKTCFKQSPVDSAFVKLRPKVQEFTIDNKKTTTITAANGTKILVPSGCFVDGNGNNVTGNITIEVVEAFSLKDFLASGLATVSGNRLLISNGMMYINARSGDTRLQLNKGAAMQVFMPTMKNNYGFEMFTGDGSNWKQDSTMTQTDYLTTYPLNLLYPNGNDDYFFCITQVGEDEKIYHFDTTIMSITNPKYENTVIATREFVDRMNFLLHMMYRMSYFANSNYYFDDNCEEQQFNYDIMRVYFDHPNRSFSESDSIAKKMYVDYFNKNEQKLEDFCERVNEYKRSYYSNWTDTNYYFDFREVSMRDDYMELLKYFPGGKQKEIKIFNTHGVNPDAADAFEQLKAKGVDEKEINELLAHHFRRRSVIQQLQRYQEVKANKEDIEELYKSTVFSITTMGWINCDRFYDDPTAGKAEMYVSNGTSTDLDFIDCSLVIPELNVRLTAFEDKPGRYSFTQKDGRYVKLPIGKNAVIVGVAMQHDSVFFASQKIRIKDGYIIKLPMKYTSPDALNDSLIAALK